VAHRGRQNADEALALALASGQTVRDAAAAVGIAERTATRRWADAAFRRHVAELRGEMATRALGRLADGMGEAASTLRELLADSTPPAVRLGAARCLLELGVKLREAIDLEQRLTAVEARYSERKNP
jgi:transposase-like protein